MSGDAGTDGISNPVAAATQAQAGRERIDAGTARTSNPGAAATSAQPGRERIDAGTTATSNLVAAATSAQADGESIETTGASIPVAAATPAQGDEEIIDAEIPGTSNPVATPAIAVGEIIDEGTAETSNNSCEHVVISMARPPFRDVNKDLLTPLSVPIGPYHRAICSDRWREEKQRVANVTLNSLEDQLKENLRELEGVVKERYSGLPNMESEEFVSMLLEDGCYVLSSLVKYHEHLDVIPPRGERNTVMRDILYLLENQLPMIVLERIHQCLKPGRSVVEDVDVYVRWLLKEQLYIREDKPRDEQAAPCHLLQLVHSYFQPLQPYVEGTDNTHRHVGRWRRATEYSRYGNVQLKRRDFEPGVVESIIDVSLEGSTLWIPHLRIDSSTWTILRNLMALEEETGTGRSPVTAYCLFMSQLASKVEDIELLMRKKIVDHSLGNDEEVAQGFADLWKKVVLDDVDNVDSNYLRDTWYLLHERCESRGHNFWGSFRHIHCGDYMRILAFVTAGLLFAFQLIQVILAGLSLRQQGK